MWPAGPLGVRLLVTGGTRRAGDAPPRPAAQAPRSKAALLAARRTPLPRARVSARGCAGAGTRTAGTAHGPTARSREPRAPLHAGPTPLGGSKRLPGPARVWPLNSGAPGTEGGLALAHSSYMACFQPASLAQMRGMTRGVTGCGRGPSSSVEASGDPRGLGHHVHHLPEWTFMGFGTGSGPLPLTLHSTKARRGQRPSRPQPALGRDPAPHAAELHPPPSRHRCP